ncbi:chromosome segregation protein [Sporotomaculum syntrophicum]|uniref:Nuclease SbcCD subunit C n=1 Tax=Sporotomaculum syntrophicum TaxID=182264 RepID=A0A9D3AYA1_9FIRM|nr:AAA family ATPase [Sporotomaculum syntrophicum]KAF1085226.1 chromosome segregation protein [Sporotomaculum syntrophicum]
MKIKYIKCKKFGGVSNKIIKFEDGLNVIVGANEAGKSTVIDAMFAALFRSHNLKRNTNIGRDFYEKYLPYPDGDSAVVETCFNINNLDFEISKEWGIAPSGSVRFDGKMLKDEGTMTQKLQEALGYGENTFKNIVFARQKDIREALEKISKDEETSAVIDNILKRAVMVLDGISVEKLKKLIDQKLLVYSAKWDLANNRPEGNKGINNPWKRGIGSVLAAYYQKEQLKQDMESAQKVETEFSLLSEKLKAVRARKQQIKEQGSKYAQFEGDIIQRSILESQLLNLQKKAAVLREVYKQFPIMQMELSNKGNELQKLETKAQQLEDELKSADLIQKAQQTKQLLAKVDSISQAIAGKIAEQNKLVEIKDEEIRRLDKLHESMLSAKAKMEAGTLLGRLNKSQGYLVFVTRGLHEREELTEGANLTASGYLRVEIEDGFDLEVRAGEVAFAELKRQYKEAEEELTGILSRLNVPDLAQAKVNHRLYKQLQSDINSLQKQIETLLGDKTVEQLKASIQLEKNLSARDVKEINQDKQKINSELTNLKAEVISLAKTFKEWTDKYENPDKVIDLLTTTLISIKETEAKLQNLAALPQEFRTTEEFLSHLKQLRAAYEQAAKEDIQLTQDYYAIKLPDVSFEELAPLYKEAELNFEKQLAHLHCLLQIKQTLNRKLKELDQGSNEPLVELFSKYLSILTLGKYSVGKLRGNLEVGIIKEDNIALPSTLFSAGTYDCVLLALRFALLEYLFKDKQGFVVLDDCLVNLDPDRKVRAVELIKEYARNNQVIFTTCDPATADLLSGNVIHI